MFKILPIILCSALLRTTQPIQDNIAIDGKDSEIVEFNEMDDTGCMAYLDQEDYANALQCYENIIETKEAKLGSDPIDVIGGYNKLMLIYGLLEKTEEKIKTADKIAKKLSKQSSYNKKKRRILP